MIEQVVIQDGRTVPGDCQLICNYNAPEDFEEFKKLRNAEKLADNSAPKEEIKDEKKADDEEDDHHSVHYGLSLVACGKQNSPSFR